MAADAGRTRPPDPGGADASTTVVDEVCGAMDAWLRPQDVERTLVVRRMETPVAVDGSLDDAAHGAAPALELRDPMASSDNGLVVRASWDAEHLIVGVRVTDATVRGDASGYAGGLDGIELFVDTAFDRGATMDLDDYQWIVPVEGEPLVRRGERQRVDMAIEHGVATGEDGYSVELRVPWAEIGVTPAPGLRLGLLVANNDADAGELRSWSWGGVSPFKQPARWGALRLGGTDCEEEVTVVDPEAPVGGPLAGGDELGPIGGGPDYTRIVDPADATVVVRTLEELRAALGRVGRGDVVYVADDAEIDTRGVEDMRIPAGVTLASGRGRDGSLGGLIYKDEFNVRSVFIAGSGVRITGLRLRGPHVGIFIAPECRSRETCTATGCGVAWSYDALGIRANHDDIEIDNNEISGWTYAGVSTNASPHIHHNHIHGNAMQGLGYGVTGCGGKPVIEYNYFDENKHSIAECGNGGYIARHNVFGETAMGHILDVHPDGGRTTIIHNNTILAVEDFCGEPVRSISIRGTPSDICHIHHNWFFADSDSTIRLRNRTNTRVEDNHFGTDEPGMDIGAPR